jgi:hypothetical protein
VQVGLIVEPVHQQHIGKNAGRKREVPGDDNCDGL